jgi:2-polyprenyl-6-methoxyphenol hydroxylase-like FAD-dependent oxidoreductase
MTIHWSKPLLEKLLPTDLWERLHEAQADPSFDARDAAEYSIPFYDLKTGKHLKSAPVPHAIRVSRRKMRAFCAQGIDVQYGKSIIEINYDGEKSTVKAVFADGTSLAGSVLIGSDGHRSKVRELLLGKEKGGLSPIPGGVQLVGLRICYDDARKARHVRQLHPINWGAFHGEKSLSVWTAGKYAELRAPDILLRSIL